MSLRPVVPAAPVAPANTAAPARHSRVAFLGFSDAERQSLTICLRLANQRAQRYQVVYTLTDADFLVADADHAPSVQLVVVTERVAETLFVGAHAPHGAAPALRRPIDTLQVLDALDALPRNATPATLPPAVNAAVSVASAAPSAPNAPTAPIAPIAPTAPFQAVAPASHFWSPPPEPELPPRAPDAGLIVQSMRRAEVAAPPAAPPAVDIELDLFAEPPLVYPPAPPVLQTVVEPPALPSRLKRPPHRPGQMPAHIPAQTPAQDIAQTPAQPATHRPAPKPPPVGVAARPLLMGPPAPPRALLVDDSAIALRFLGSRLQPWGVRSLAVTGSAAALAELAQRSYDLVFLDLELGEDSELDGLGLCQRIKRGGLAPHAMVVMVSAHHSEIDRARGALAGCDGYLSKPLKEIELATLLRGHGLKPWGAEPA